MRRTACWLIVLGLWTIAAVPSAARADAFQSDWPKNVQRPWLGPAYWANPLQDWRLADGRIECFVSGGDRNVHLLTHQLARHDGDFRLSVRLGRLDRDGGKLDDGLVGFRFAVRGPLEEYRNNLLSGRGIAAGITTDGRLLLGSARTRQPLAFPPGVAPLEDIELRLEARPQGDDGNCRVVLSALDPSSGTLLGKIEQKLPGDSLHGNVALLCSRAGGKGKPRQGTARGGNVRFWFADWKVEGSKVEAHPEQVFGPILFAQYTLSRGVMKLTAQMPPLGPGDSHSVKLETRTPQGDWKPIGRAAIDPLARTATFRIANWDATRDTPYRLVYPFRGEDHEYRGTIRRDPVDKKTIVVAAFTGHQDYAFPNTVIASNVAAHDPDVLFFSGDQIYENNAGYGIQREPVETACLDYLRKWYVFGWGFRDLMRDRPSITIPDDHDVYQPNIWGAGGRKVELKRHDAGGYVMDPAWVNAIQRMQTSHLPDPYDPTPIEQGITVYYTAMTYGRISFAVIEDRKWKSGPRGLCPPTGGRPDWVTDPHFDPKTADLPGAVLLGRRQRKFLADWAADWRGADFKLALSQTIFCGSCSLHGGNRTRLVADYDCNGWPQTGRNRALAELRKGFALHIAGDQHLASLIHQGIDDFDDAAWSFCVPSIAAGYPRVWAPLQPGADRRPGMPEYTGRFHDGLGNKMTVWAVANPDPPHPDQPARRDPVAVARAKASGYGIVRLDKTTRRITLECWPLDENPRDPAAVQYPGWPRTIDQEENYDRRAKAYLPTIRVHRMTDPVVQVIDEANNEIVYTLRIHGTSFRPKVFAKGKYTVKVGEPASGMVTTLGDLPALDPGQQKTIDVRF